MVKLGTLLLLLFPLSILAQKKPLDHTVYDGWENIEDRKITPDGRYLLFTVNPQEGDGRLVMMRTDGSWTMEVPRGYGAAFTADSRYAVFKIKPAYADTRDARIKKKKPDDMPKDSLGWLALGTTNLQKLPRIKAFSVPVSAGAWAAVHLEKPLPDTTKKKPAAPKNPQLDSAKRVIDSLEMLLGKLPEKVKRRYLDDADDYFAEEPAAPESSGTELLWLSLIDGETKKFARVNEYTVDKYGNSMAMEIAKPGKDSLSKAAVIVFSPSGRSIDTVLLGFNDVKNMALDEQGNQLAFVAERDSSDKAKKKYMKLWYWRRGADSANMIADRQSNGKMPGWLIHDKANINFSKSGTRLFFGVAPEWPDKDTSQPEFDRVALDVWHYNDDYLQTVQLKNLQRELDRSYLAVYHPATGKVLQLGDKNLPEVRPSGNGDGKWFWAMDDRASRIASQWAGRGKADLYLIDPETGQSQMIKAGMDGQLMGMDPAGKQVAWYSYADKQYHVWRDGLETVPSKGITVPLYDEENDVPDDPNPHGMMAWEKSGQALFVYDKYDVWRLDPTGSRAPQCITGGSGRKSNITIRHQNLNPEEPWVQFGEDYLYRLFHNGNKEAGLAFNELGKPMSISTTTNMLFPTRFANILKAREANMISYSTEDYQHAPDMRAAPMDYLLASPMSQPVLYKINPQQEKYFWGTAELISWKAYDGNMTQGIVYKPENFDPTKKYPMIAYFYETLSDGLYSYQAPAPTPSRLNIPFFVSRGYVVFAPDIHYRIGYPGRSAYDYIVSGARHLVKQGYVDSTRMGLQGQSWGGYQIAYLITQTPLFAAAWAGAPVANMTSAYGGIRWGTGLNRQFQYEKTQSRIGGNLWEKKNLYLENSPLFYIPNIKTPLVIMHNDEDGAVPWYQGIEMFTAMRRLGKKVWMLNYNGEDHNLVQRKNRKDISIREQQFFDWLLKDAPPPAWLREGVPATMKGRTLGLGN